MLATTRMTKSFKMVLLRVLLDNDAVFSGMPIPELAAKCREFLVAHEFLRRDIADAATGQPVEMSPRKWESSWRKFPISIWMQEQEGREWEVWFVKIACNVAGPCGSNVGDTLPNGLPTLLREWFGPDAGLPGTSFQVEFHRDGDAWHIAPLRKEKGDCHHFHAGGTHADRGDENGDCHLFPGPMLSSPPPTSRFTTHVPVYDLTAAAGFWGPESVPEELGWTEVPGVAVKPGMFVTRVTGTSMEPLIPDGSWCLFRPCPAGSREGRIVLVQFASLGSGENGGRSTVKKCHSELSPDLAVTADGWRHSSIQLLPVNPAFEPITLEPEDANDLTIIGEFVRVAS
jgi:SOS-response transcriptional repressor LexA